jgi:nitrile hydratase accessory protein
LKLCDLDDRPVFSAPWQAQVFALAVHLNEKGVFSWREWGEVFSEQRRRSAEAGVADAADRYYYDWLCALERLLIDKDRASADALRTFKQAWVEAYLRTPHGDPVVLDPVAASGR